LPNRRPVHGFFLSLEGVFTYRPVMLYFCQGSMMSVPRSQSKNESAFVAGFMTMKTRAVIAVAARIPCSTPRDDVSRTFCSNVGSGDFARPPNSRLERLFFQVSPGRRNLVSTARISHDVMDFFLFPAPGLRGVAIGAFGGFAPR